MRSDKYWSDNTTTNSGGSGGWFIIAVLIGWILTVTWILSAGAGAQQGPTLADRKAICTTLVELRKDYPPKMNEKQVGEMLNRATWVHELRGLGMLGKAGGNRCGSQLKLKNTKGKTTTVSCDFILHLPSGLGWDALIDAGGTEGLGDTRVSFDVNKQVGGCATSELKDLNAMITAGSRSKVPPIHPGSQPEPEPEPEPIPTPKPPAPCAPDVRLELNECRKEVDSVRQSAQEMEAALRREIHELNLKIAGVGCKPGNILGIRGFHNGCDVTWGATVIRRTDHSSGPTTVGNTREGEETQR